MNYTDYSHCDYDLFLALNFDGGNFMDRLMLTVSGTLMWLPLYALICVLIVRREGWRNLLIFVVLLGIILALSDMIPGIFKGNGLLGDLMPGFSPRCRPMYTPQLEGLGITPDSLAALRREGLRAGEWIVHVPMGALGGRYGTVSAHAATVVGLAVMSAGVIRRRWFTILIVCCTVLICYSRIYLGKHFPLDLLWGSLVGIVLGGGALWLYRRISRKKGAQ